MQIENFLVINERGGTKLYKNRPVLNSNEISVRLKINVPKEYFERQIPLMEFDLPKEAMVYPDAETVIKVTAQTIAENLKVEVTEVEDYLRQMIERKKEKDLNITDGATHQINN